MIKWALLASATVCAPLLWGIFIKAESLKTESPEQVPYPEGYRRWMRVESGLNRPKSPDNKNTGEIHHTYANDKAMAAVEDNQGRRFPEGSVIVRDILEVQTKDGVTTEGRRLRVTVMHKDSKRF